MGYTQQQVADAIGITNSTYCGYETGKRQPDVFKIKKLANFLKTSGDYLLETGFDEKEKSPAPEEPETGDGVTSEEKRGFNSFCEAMVDMGFVREGEDLTDAQLSVLLGVLQILDATFPNRSRVVISDDKQKIG